MIFSTSSDSKPAYQEISDNEDLPVPKYRRHVNLWQYCSIAFLAFAWMITLGLYLQLSIATKPRPTPIPHEVFTRVKTIFQPDARYIGPSIETNHNWDHLVAGHDALWVEDPKKWGLPGGIIAPFDHPNQPNPPPKSFYVVSILHQLHCLNMIRSQYWQARKGADPALDPDAAKWAVHIDHCYEYLRQAISCGGDLIIEGSSPLGHATSVTGWGVSHDCINFEILRSYQFEQERQYNLTWQFGLE